MSLLIRIALFHALFASFNNLNVFLYMAVPVRNFFARSLLHRYGITPDSKSFELIYSSTATLYLVGSLVSGLFSGYLMERYGRRGTAIHIRSVLGIFGALCMLLASWFGLFELFMLGHFLNGCTSMLKTVLFIYLAECAPDRARGWLIMLVGTGSHMLPLAVALPLSLPGVFGSDRLWWVLPLVCLAMASAHLAIASGFPESPKHLFIARGKKDEARRSILFYHGPGANIVEQFNEYTKEQRLLAEGSVKWGEFVTNKKLRWSMVTTLVVSSLPYLSLMSIRGQYQLAMLMQFGMDQAGAVVADMVLLALTSPLSLCSPLCIGWGRRPFFSLLASLALIELLLIMLSRALLPDHAPGSRPLPLVLALALLGFLFGHSAVSLGLAHIPNELFPHQARAKATQVSYVLLMLLQFVVVSAYPLLAPSLGPLFFAPLALFSALSFLFMRRWLPETQNLSVERIFRRLTFTVADASSEYGTIRQNGQEVGEEEENCGCGPKDIH